MDYIQFFGGLIYLLMGGDLLVRGAVALARRAQVTPLMVALTVVSFGTSVPELVVTIQAVLAGYPGMAIGNVVGSNIANVLLVAGAPAVVYPLICDRVVERRNAAIMLVVSVVFYALCLLGDLDRLAGVILLLGLALLTGYTVWSARRDRLQIAAPPAMEWVLGLPSRTWMIVLFIVIGAAALPVGGWLMVGAAIEVSMRFGVSEAFIGLTVVAVGTSLPELATAFVAVFRRETEVAVGTLTGSCVFNIVGIMGLAALVSPSPIPVPIGFSSLDLPVMLAAALALTFLVWYRRVIGRVAGIAMVAGYVAYLVVLVSNA
ncbi:MAG: calcium/sodium antiporter [Gemmatimonadales bacterium]